MPPPSEMQQAIERQPAELRRLAGDLDSVRRAHGVLEGAPRLVLVGTGTSWHASNHGAWLLRAAGVRASAAQAMDAVLYPEQVFEPGDGVVVLSHGNTKRYTTELASHLRREGHPYVVIGGTHAPEIDILTVDKERSAAFTVSHTAALLRLAQLATLYGGSLDLDSVPELVEEAIALELPLGEPPERSVEFVGSGPNQWAAAEGALKVREASYVAAQGLSVEQFLHGPAAAADSRDLVVALRAEGPGLERVDAVADAAVVAGADVLRVGPFPTSEALSIFPLTVCVQRVALGLALRANVNPDLFRTETHNAWKDVGL